MQKKVADKTDKVKFTGTVTKLPVLKMNNTTSYNIIDVLCLI